MSRHSVLAVTMAAALLALGACSSGDEQHQMLPAIELELVDGGVLDLTETGRPRVINLWATWCAPCRAELPAFDAVAATTDGIDIIGVNVGESGDDARQLIDELGLRFPQALDPKAEIQTGLRITGMPATIFVSEAGELVEIHSGELDQGELESLLAEHYADGGDPANGA